MEQSQGDVDVYYVTGWCSVSGLDILKRGTGAGCQFAAWNFHNMVTIRRRYELMSLLANIDYPTDLGPGFLKNRIRDFSWHVFVHLCATILLWS